MPIAILNIWSPQAEVFPDRLVNEVADDGKAGGPPVLRATCPNPSVHACATALFLCPCLR